MKSKSVRDDVRRLAPKGDDENKELADAYAILSTAFRPARKAGKAAGGKIRKVTGSRIKKKGSVGSAQSTSGKTAGGRALGKAAGSARTVTASAGQAQAQMRKAAYKSASTGAKAKQMLKNGLGKLGGGLKNALMGVMKKALPLLAGALLSVTVTLAPLVAIIAVLYNSPFAILLPDIEGDEPTVENVAGGFFSDIIRQVEMEERMTAGYDSCETYGKEDLISEANLWDAVCVYMVRYGQEEMATVMDSKGISRLQTVVEDMVSYETDSYETTEFDGYVEVPDEQGMGGNTSDDSGGSQGSGIILVPTYRTAYHKVITVKLRYAAEMADSYGFTQEQREQLDKLLRRSFD